MLSSPRSTDCLPVSSQLVALQTDGQFEMLAYRGISGEGEVEAGGVRLHHIASVEVEKWLVSPTDQPPPSLNQARHCEGPHPPLLPPHTEVQGPPRNILTRTLSHHLTSVVMRNIKSRVQCKHYSYLR